MKANKIKKPWNAGDLREVPNLPQVVSNSNLNQQFWNSLKDTIKSKKENQSIKGRIFTAKRILTPIIQELMKDALEQIEAEDKKEDDKEEVEVLYDNVEAKDVWHLQTDSRKDGEDWAMKILDEINRDLEQPFDKLHQKDDGKLNEEPSPKDIILNKKLLTKLVAIHQHLGNIIERLKVKCEPRRRVDADNKSLNHIQNREDTIMSESFDIRKKSNLYNVESSANEDHPSFTDAYEGGSTRREKGEIMRVQTDCYTALQFRNKEKRGHRPLRESSHQALFEERKNEVGNKQIVIKCLEDMEKVRIYLEAIRDNKDCEKPRFKDLESCNNDSCLESEPHLHSNLHNMPMVLKLNKHAERNERNSDLIIGIPSLTTSRPDVHILLDTKKKHVDIQPQPVLDHRNQSQHKHFNRVSKIPKPIGKTRDHSDNFSRASSMRTTSTDKRGSRKKATNLLIFDPDDPCNSIIKMKEQKKPGLNDFKSLVSKTGFTLKCMMILMVKLRFCCIGGQSTILKIDIGLWLLFLWFPNQKNHSIHLLCLHLSRQFVLRYSLSLSWALCDDFSISLSISEYLEKLSIREDAIYKCESEGLLFSNDQNLDQYVERILNFMTYIKKPFKHTSANKCDSYKKGVHQLRSFQPVQCREMRTQAVYFFEFIKGNKKESTPTSAKRTWNEHSDNVAAFPVWTIKRSKYYSVPESKKKDLDPQVEEMKQEENSLTLEDSLEILAEPHNETQMQMSEISVKHSKSEESNVDDEENSKKTEIKRKVSFREEVDISGFGDDDRNLEQNLPDSTNCDDTYFEEIIYTQEKSPSLDIDEDLEEINSKISDLLMTDSLIKMSKEIPNCDSKRQKQTTKKKPLENLELTDSARHILANLSKSFENEEYSNRWDDEITMQFYDKHGKPITEICNSYGDLLKQNNGNPEDLSSLLFDNDGVFIRNRYDSNGKRIKAVYDANGKKMNRLPKICSEKKGIQADFETVEYYDCKGNPINRIYDHYGYEIQTVGKDLTSRIFDEEGKLRKGIYSSGGKIIEAVFDSYGQLLGKSSKDALEPVLRNEQIRVAEVDNDSKNKVFENGIKSVELDNGDSVKKGASPKRLFDQEGKPLFGVYDKKGKPIKLTSSGEADELLPFLFDDKGKLQSKRFDSNGKELKAVFGENGKAISEMSITWLNELLANSKGKNSKQKKKESIVKNNTNYKDTRDSSGNIEKIFDANRKMITGIFDSKGKPLAISSSGNADKLIPFIFDEAGKFIKKRYDSEKRKIRCVYGNDGNVIPTISVTYLRKLARKEIQNKPVNEEGDNSNLKTAEDSQKTETQKPIDKTEEDDQNIKILELFERVPDDLFDEDGEILTEVFDSDGKVLATSTTGNAWKLIPHLFNQNGEFLKNVFDKKGRELIAVYNKDGENLNKDLSAAINVTINETFAQNDENEEKKLVNEKENEGKVENEAEEIQKNGMDNAVTNREMDSTLNIPDKVSSMISSQKSSEVDASKKKSSTSEDDLIDQENEQLNSGTSIEDQHSIHVKFDNSEETLKAGQSIYGFYDERGNLITEVYDYEGRNLIKEKSGDVEKMARFLFDKNGYMSSNIYDRKGKRIKRIYDDSRRSISRISMTSIISRNEINIDYHENHRKTPGSVYDKNGNLVRKIYDKEGDLMLSTSLGRFEDLAPIIFDEKGVRRQVFDKSGCEMGPFYDHKGKELKHLSKKPRSMDCPRERRVFNRWGKPLRNFYDSEGTLIIALYNDHGKTLCSVKKGVDNVDKLSKFLFDKKGHFLRKRFYNFRGRLIKHVYDSDSNLVRSIEITESRRMAKYRSHDHHERKNTGKKQRNTSKPKHVGSNMITKDGDIDETMRNFSSQSDTIINPVTPIVQRSFSAYSLRDYPKRKDIEKYTTISSNPSLTNMPIKKFYDENGVLLTGVYNSKTRLLGYTASGNARVLAPYLFDLKGNFIPGRLNLNRNPLKSIYDSEGNLIKKISKPALKKRKEAVEVMKKNMGFKFYDLNGEPITSVYDFHGKKILDVRESSEKLTELFDADGNLKKNLYDFKGSKLKVYDDESEEESLSEDESSDTNDSKRRFSALSNFKDKILTVIFDNQKKLTKNFSLQSSKKRKRSNPEDGDHMNNMSREEVEKKKSYLYDKNLNVIQDIYDTRRKKIKKLYNLEGKVIDELYSPSGTLIKNNVLKYMFEKNLFKPKVFDSEGNMIKKIYANKRRLTEVFDQYGTPALADSDLIYLVSKNSLPPEEQAQVSKSRPKQVNYFSEGKFSWFFSKLRNEM